MNRRTYAVIALMILLIVPASLVLTEKDDETSFEIQTPVFESQFEDPEYIIEGDFRYTLENGTLSMEYYYGDSYEVIIPSEVMGYPVTSIHYFGYIFNSSITSVHIPSSVKQIYDYAFWNCTSLEQITVDDENTNYSSVDGVLFDKNLTTLIRYPSGMAGNEYDIPSGVENIRNYAFSDCVSLETITIPSSVNEIGAGAFENCISLTSADIPYGVTYIENRIFNYCISLKSVSLPESIYSIGWSAFYGCASLESITLPSRVYYVGDEAFEGCGLTSIHIRNLDAYFGMNSLNLSSEECVIYTDDINFYIDEYVKGDSTVVFTNEFECTVVFVANDEVIGEQIFREAGGNVTVPENPVKEGYNFIGWYPKVGPAERNVVYVAQFEKYNSAVLKEFAEGLYNIAQTFDPYFISNENDYEIWEGTKTIDKVVTVSKDLVFKDGLVLKFKNNGKIVIPSGLDLIINGTVEFENAGSKIQIEFTNGVEQSKSHSIIYAGQIHFTTVYIPANDETNSVVMTCDNSFTLGLKMENTFGDNIGDSFILDYELYIDIHGTEDVELKTVTSYNYLEEHGETTVRNNPDGKELYLRINGDVSALYEFATGFENESWIEILDELINLIDNGSMTAPDLKVKVEIYDITKNNVQRYGDNSDFGSDYSSEIIFEGINLSFESKSKTNTVEFSLNLINFKFQEKWMSRYSWSSSFIEDEYRYRGIDDYGGEFTISLSGISLKANISSGYCDVVLDADEIYVKISSNNYGFGYGKFEKHFSETEIRASDTHFAIDVETAGFKNFIVNFISEINKGNNADFSAVLDDVAGFDIKLNLSVGNVELTGPTYYTATRYIEDEYITLEEFIKNLGNENYENINSTLCSNILFSFSEENGTVHIVFSVDTVEGEGVTISNFAFDTVADVSYAGEFMGTLHDIMYGAIDSDEILALFDSLGASSGQSIDFSIGSATVTFTGYGSIVEMKLNGFFIKESLISGKAEYSMGFREFETKEFSIFGETNLLEHTRASDVNISGKITVSGMRSVLSDFLEIITTNPDNPNIETFIREMNLSINTEETWSIGSIYRLYQNREYSVKNFRYAESMDAEGRVTLTVTLNSIETDFLEIYGLDVTIDSTYADMVNRYAEFCYRYYILNTQEDMDKSEILRDIYEILLSDTSINVSVGFNRLYIIDGIFSALLGLEEGYEFISADEAKAILFSFDMNVNEADDLQIDIYTGFSLNMSDNAVIEIMTEGVWTHILAKSLNLSWKAENGEEPIDLWNLIVASDKQTALNNVLDNIHMEITLTVGEVSAYSKMMGYSMVVTDFELDSISNFPDFYGGYEIADIFGEYELKFGTLTVLTGTVFNDSSNSVEGPAVGFMTADGSRDYAYCSFNDLTLSLDDYGFNAIAVSVTADIKSGYNAYSTRISEETLRLDNEFSLLLTGEFAEIQYREISSTQEFLPGFINITVKNTTVSADSGILKGEVYMSGSEIQVRQMGTGSTGTPFTGWKVNEILYLEGDFVRLTSETVKIEEIYDTLYSITYKDGESVLHTDHYIRGDRITEYSPSGKAGYIFVKWNSSVPSTMPAENLTFTAVWTVNQYTLTFNSNGGTSVAPITSDYGAAVTAPANPTKTGYTFDRWDRSVPSTMPAENLTFYAVWTVNQYMLTFDSNGGTSVAPITSDYGAAVTVPANPTKEGYIFKSWSLSIPATMPAKDMKFTAVWYKVVAIAADSSDSSINIKEDGIAITGNDLERLRSNADGSENPEYIDITLKNGTIHLPKGAIDVMVDTNNKGKNVLLSLEISIGLDDERILEKLDGVMKGKIADAFVVSVNLSNVKSTKDLGDVKIVVPYTLKEGEKGSDVKVYFIDDDGSLEEKNARYFEEGGIGYVEFTTTHFSDYVILFESSESLGGISPIYIIVIAVMLILIILTVVVIRRN